MKIETLKERIEKKEAQIVKKQNTITKKTKHIEKKQKLIDKKRKELEDISQYGEWYQENMTDKKDLETEIRWTENEIKYLKDDIRRLHREIDECATTLEKYEDQLAGEIEKEAQFIKEVPESVKLMEQQLIEKWDESEKKRKNFLSEKCDKLGYRDFVKQYSYSAYEFLFKTDEDIHKSNEKHAREFVLDLLNRTKEITGEITSWAYVHLTVGTNGYPVLNGVVEGKEGRAVVESIYAGGYNIQRLHVRVLVKAC